MKITKRQLKRIIKEEKQRVLNEITPGLAGIAAMGGGTPADQGFAAAASENPRHGGEHGVFDENYWENLIFDEVKDYLQSNNGKFLTMIEAEMIERSITNALSAVMTELAE